MIEKKIAICVPTYGRSAVIKELLSLKLKLYHEIEMDLYIYDSNEDDETEKITKAFQAEFDNLFYVRLPPEMHANMKVYKIYQKYGWVKEYDYVWVCQDALRFSRSLLEKITGNAMDAFDCDVIVVHHISRYCTACEYTDKNNFFLDCAWQMALFGGAILNVSTMLENVPWDALTERYNVPEMVNFSHVGFYFERVAVLDRFRARRIGIEPFEIVPSALRKTSEWVSNTFSIWLYYWVKTIKSLPDSYLDKNRAIKRLGKYSGIFDTVNLIELRQNGFLDKKVYNQYKAHWAKYSGKSKLAFFVCAHLPLFVLITFQKRIKIFRLIKCIMGINQLKAFCKKNEKIYIYGVGQVATRYAGYLQKSGVDIAAFLATNIDEQKDSTFCGRPIISYLSLPSHKKTGVILGLNPKNAIEVRGYLNDSNYSGDIFDKYIPK